ncbi:MG2 domain-containing protein [Myxococcota bacterium]|nr:MG2 domain-containing protein [Myxococcota bacterium]
MSARRVRLFAWGTALSAVVALAACKKEGTRDAPSAETPAPGEAPPAAGDEGDKKPSMPTADSLRPVLSEQGEDGVAPSAIAIELAEPAAEVYGTSVEGNVLVFEPAVRGTFAWKSPSSLVFTPAEPLAPDTEYSVRLEAIETKQGVVDLKEAGISRKFRTPAFALVRTAFSAFDPKKNRLEVELVFSSSVDVSSLKSNASWTVNGMPVGRVSYEATDRKNVARATLFDKKLELGTTVKYVQDPGVKHAGGSSITAPAGGGDIRIAEGEPITVLTSYVQEGANGFYVAIVCKDEGSGKDQDYYWDEHTQESYYISKRCVLEESDALESVHFSPPVKFSVAAMRGGFRLIGNFSRGTYSMRIDANARSIDGGVLKKPYVASFSVPARKPQLSFVSQGRYLPKSAWQNLAIRHMNVSTAELTVRHIPVENLVFWMGAEQETADERSSDVILKKKLPLKSDADQLATSWVDVGAMIPTIPRGVVELQIATEGAVAKSRLMVTDINLVAKQQGTSGKVWVWALDMHTNAPIPGVTVKQVVKSGRTVSSCNTDRLGGCEVAGLTAKDLELDPSPTFALVASREGDVTYLKFDELRTEIADAFVHGRPYTAESPYRAAIYGDRGVYRPGETAHVAAILRGKDDLAPPEGMPVEVRLLDPKKKVAKKRIEKTNAAGHLAVDFKFDDFATTGTWEVVLEAGKKVIESYRFQVEEFVPERMKVTAKAEKPDLLVTEQAGFAVEAKYLFGGSASGSRVEVSCELRPTEFKPKANANYEYGVWYPAEKPPQALAIGNSTGAIGDDDKGRVTCPPLTQRGTLAGAARLSARIAVFEAGSGRTTQADASAYVHPERFYVGLQTGTKKVKAGEAFEVRGLVVDWSGAPVPEDLDVELELFQVESEHDWIYEESEGYWSYRNYTRLASQGKLPKVKASGGKFTVTVTPGSDAAAYVVRAKAAKAQTDLRVEGSAPFWYWWGEESGRDQTPRPLKPATVELTAPESTKVGEKTVVKYVSPFKGRALLTVETDEVLISEWVDVQPGPAEWSFKLPKFAPNVYFAAFVVKDPHEDSKESFLPSRAFGVTSVRVEPEAFAHTIQISAPSEIRSNSKLEVGLDLGKLDEPTFVTVAAVDEGILSLTRFDSPDPLAMIFDARALGILSYETIGWNLLLPAGGPSRSSGGDGEGAGQGRVQPVKPVALWSGVVAVPASGKVSVGFDVPQYRGSLRVMAVSAGKKRMGSASANVIVRDPLVLQTTLPRFLSYGDDVEVPVFVTNMSGSPQDVDVKLVAEALPVPGLVSMKTPSAEELIEVKGETTKKLRLGKDGSGRVVFEVKALQAVGAAKLKVRVEAGALASSEELDVPFVPAAPKTREVKKIELAEGTTDLLPYLKGWVPTTERTTIWVTSNPYGESFDHLKHLIHYPYGCIEQTTSATRPLLYVAELVQNVDPTLTAQAKIEDLVMAGVNRILSMQTAAGGFGYWPGEQQPTPWGTAYAVHLLLDAQKLRYPVPEERVKDALEWIERELTSKYESGAADRSDWYHWENAEPYMQYVLAVGGKGRKARIEKLIEELRPKARSSSEKAEQLYMLKAALFLSGDQRYAADLKSPDVAPVKPERQNSWSFYSDRRRRGFMLATFTDLFGDDPAGEKLANLVAESLRGHSSSWYTTQELVWGITGLGKRIGASAKSYSPGVLVANGKKLAADGAAAGQKTSDRSWTVARASEHSSLEVEVSKIEGGKLYAILSSEGVKENATYQLGGQGLKLDRTYRSVDGEPLALTSGALKLGDMVYAAITISNTTGERVQNIALVDRFPAGWEIENPRLGRGAGALTWVDAEQVWSVDSMNLRDDRIELFGALGEGETKTVVYALRAVTAGRFAMPPVEAEAMYYPEYWAREGGQRVTISAPWAREGE